MANFNPYYNNYLMQDLQGLRDRIDRTMQQYQQAQSQYMQPQQPPITQNFQISPTQPQTEIEGKYANNIDEVKNTFVIKTGIFTTKDFSTIWVKDVTGNIKTYKTQEVIELDEKDKKILEQNNTISALQQQINELKGAIMNGTNTNNSTELSQTVANKKSTRISDNKSDDKQ